MRNTFAKTFYDAAKADPRLCVVVADISPTQLALNRQQADTLGFASAIERWVEDLRAMQETGLRGRFSYGPARSTPLACGL